MRDRLLSIIADLAWRHPRAILFTAVLAALAGGTHASLCLRMNADTDDLISSDQPWMRTYKSWIREFGDLEDIYVVVDSRGDTERARACVDRLLVQMRALPTLPAVHGRIEPEEQWRIMTRAMPVEDLEGLVQAAPAVQDLASWKGVDAASLLRRARGRIRTLVTQGATLSEARRRAQFASAVLEFGLIAGASGTPRQHDLSTLLDLQPEYLTTEDGQLFFVQVKPVKDYGTLAVIEKPLADIRAAIDSVRRAFPDLDIGLTGKPVLQADEMRTTDQDMLRASLVAIVLVALLFMVVLRGVLLPLLCVGSLLVAIAWTFGLTSLVLGQLNLLSVVFTLILVGIGIDFGIHISARFQDERRRREPREALRHALLTSGRGNVTGAVTSSTAFLMALFTDFRGLQELGFVAGSGLLLCLVSMTLLLPALIRLTHARPRSDPDRQGAAPRPFAPARHPHAWVAALLFASLAGLPFLASSGFDGNLLDLQAQGLESVRWEQRLLARPGATTWFGAATVDSLEEAETVMRRARGEPAIGAVHSALDLVRSPTPRRARLRRALQPDDSDSYPVIVELPPAAGSVVEELRLAARAAAGLGRLAQGASPADGARISGLARQLEALAERLPSETGLLSTLDARVDRARRAFSEMSSGDRTPLRAALPAAVRERMVAPSGRLMVALHPSGNVWDVDTMESYVAAMRRVDPSVTGVPITQSESIQQMRRGFLLAALLALAAVLALVLLDFRRPRATLLAVLPLAAGALWLLEVMGVLGLQFNLANFFSVPILIGIGVDNGIHLVHRFREGGGLRNVFGSTHRGVLLTSCTSMIGFGCLAFAHHRGLQSLGLVMAIGCGTCLLGSLLLLPALLAMRSRASSPDPGESGDQVSLLRE